LASLVEWQNLYLIQQNTNDLDDMTEKPSFDSSTDIGVEGTGSGGGVFRAMLENRPALTVPDVMQELDVTTGMSERFIQNYEATVHDVPTVTIEGPANSYICSLLFWSLFQTGASEAANAGTTTYTMTCTPYDSSSPEMYFSFLRCMVDSSTSINQDDKSHYFTGCIVRSITLTAEDRGVVKYSAEIVGRQHAIANNDIGSNDTYANLSFPTAASSWKWQDFTVEIDGEPVNATNLSITFSNNVSAIFYNSDAIQAYRLGRFTVEGSFFLPWGTNDTVSLNVPVTNYKSGTDYTLEFYTDDGADQVSTGNDVDIALNVKTTELTQSGDVEIGHEVSFAAVYDGSNEAANVKMSYLASKLVRGIP